MVANRMENRRFISLIGKYTRIFTNEYLNKRNAKRCTAWFGRNGKCSVTDEVICPTRSTMLISNLTIFPRLPTKGTKHLLSENDLRTIFLTFIDKLVLYQCFFTRPKFHFKKPSSC